MLQANALLIHHRAPTQVMAALQKRKAELLKQIMGNLEPGNGYMQSKRRGRLQIARFSAESLQMVA